MRGIVIAAWITTGIFGILFIIRMVALSKIQTEYGSPVSSPPYVLGVFLGNALIPGILWIIAAATSSNSNKKSSPKHNFQTNSNDPEIKILRNEVNDLDDRKNVIKENYNLLKKSFSQGLIDQSKFDSEDERVRIEYNQIKQEISDKTKRIKAIELLGDKFKTLEQLYNKGVVTISEKELKREEQITNLTSRMK